jgi:hypothetical protein
MTPVTVATRSKAWTVFAHSKAGIVGSNLTRGMDVCVRLFCVSVVLCLRRGLATGWSLVQGVLPHVNGWMHEENNDTMSETWIVEHKIEKKWEQRLQSVATSLADFSILKMKMIRSSETSAYTRSTRRHIPEDGILHSRIDSRFLDFGTSWRWVVSFTTRPLYPRGKSPQYPLNRRMGGTQSRSGRDGEVNILNPIATRTPTPWSSSP